MAAFGQDYGTVSGDSSGFKTRSGELAGLSCERVEMRFSGVEKQCRSIDQIYL